RLRPRSGSPTVRNDLGVDDPTTEHRRRVATRRRCADQSKRLGSYKGAEKRAWCFKQRAGGEAPSPCPLPLKEARVILGYLYSSSGNRLRANEQPSIDVPKA